MNRWLGSFLVGLSMAIGFTVLALGWLALVSIAAVFSVMHILFTQMDPWIAAWFIVAVAAIYATVQTLRQRVRARDVAA